MVSTLDRAALSPLRSAPYLVASAFLITKQNRADNWAKSDTVFRGQILSHHQKLLPSRLLHTSDGNNELRKAAIAKRAQLLERRLF